MPGKAGGKAGNAPVFNKVVPKFLRAALGGGGLGGGDGESSRPAVEMPKFDDGSDDEAVFGGDDLEALRAHVEAQGGTLEMTVPAAKKRGRPASSLATLSAKELEARAVSQQIGVAVGASTIEEDDEAKEGGKHVFRPAAKKAATESDRIENDTIDSTVVAATSGSSLAKKEVKKKPNANIKAVKNKTLLSFNDE